MRTLSTLLVLLVYATIAADAQDRFDPTDPYTGGAARVYAAHDGTLYAITADLQVRSSIDDGLTWPPCGPFVSDSGAIRGVTQLAIDSSGALYGLFNNAVWCSSDSGAHWRLRLLPTSIETFGTGAFNFFIEASPHGMVFTTQLTATVSDTAIYRTSDHGETWISLSLPPGAISLTTMSIAPDGMIFAGGWGGLWRSSDEANSWTPTKLPLSASQRPIAIVAQSGGRLLAVTAPYWHFYSSNDSGETWKQMEATGLPPNTPIANVVISTHGTLLASTPLGIYRSANGGYNWQQVIELTTASAYWAAASPTGTVLAVAGELQRSTDDGATGSWMKRLDAGSPASITALYETTKGTLLAGTFDNLYRSEDGGENWIPSSDSRLEGKAVYRIMHGADSTMFASMGYASATPQFNGLYRSSNDGLNWRAVMIGLTADRIEDVLVLGNRRLLLSTASGLYRSSDNGDHWSKITNVLPTDSLVGLVRAEDGTVLVGTRGYGVWRSSNEGDTWFPSNDPGMTAPEVLSFQARPGGVVLAATATEGIFRSTDNGRSWRRSVSLRLLTNGLPWAVTATGTIYNGSGFLQRSSDDGNSWSVNINWPLAHATLVGGSLVPGLLVDRRGRLWAGISAQVIQGLRRLTGDSGAVWAADTMHLPPVHGFFENNSLNGGFYAATPRGVILRHSQDYSAQGDVWVTYRHGLENVDALALNYAVGPFNKAAGTSDGVYMLLNSDTTWYRVSKGMQSGAVNALVMLQNGTLFAGSEHGVYSITDTATGWKTVGTGLGDLSVHALTFSGKRTLLASTIGKGIFRLNDGAATWAPSGIGLSGQDVLSLAIFGATTIYAGTDSAGVYRSTDDGMQWTQAGLAGEKILSMAVNAEGLVFAGTEHGAYRSTDQGGSWIRVNGEYDGPVYALHINGTGRIYLGTDSVLYYSTTAVKDTQGTLTSVRDHAREAVSGDAMLKVVQGRTEAEIRYELLRAGHVALVLTDALGRTVRTLLDSEQPSGKHTLDLETSSLPSGTYFLQLSADGAVATQRVVVAR